jgi:putative glycosyltransferase (TIGR04348 family)
MSATVDDPAPLRIAILCPAPAGSRLGNRITALRWEKMLVELGHEAAVVDDDASADLVIALHAWKSAEAIRRARARRPERPLVVALTGTDLYGDIHREPGARESLDLADRIVVLHDLAVLDVPAEVRHKVRVVRQSAEPAPPAPRAADAFDVAFVAHARPEKDPLRPALAARALPEASRLRIVHVGRALSKDVEDALRREAAENARYAWHGEVDLAEARALIARSALLVLPSLAEGGANVLGEAIVAGTPVIASTIPACVAALGADYPGFFPPLDTAALTALLDRAERDRTFYDRLTVATAARKPLFAPSAEREAWRGILAGLAVSA